MQELAIYQKEDKNFTIYSQIMVSVLAFVCLVASRRFKNRWILYSSTEHFFRVLNFNMLELEEKNVEFLSEKPIVSANLKNKIMVGSRLQQVLVFSLQLIYLLI